MDPYIVVLASFGVVVLLTAWVPMLFKELPLSLPIFCVALGAIVFALPWIPGDAPHPLAHLKVTERVTELIVIVALTGAGLKLDRPLTWASSPLTWRLLGVAMPLTIGAVTLLGYWLLGLGLASALLLGAALAPTDPVLASDVQVGAPGEGKEDEIRYTLTAEAGLNDGLSFPFVNLAIALAAAASQGGEWFTHWVTVDVLWKLLAGVGMGVAIGRSLAWLAFRLPNRAKLSRTGDGFVALGITSVCYGLTEIVHGYGFLAVFVAALAFRSVERSHEYHERLHDFSEQFERILMMIFLVMFGGSLSSGGLLNAFSAWVLAFALVTIFVVRPLIGWISLAGVSAPADERAVIAFFGIRGVGSVYYVAYGLGQATFEKPDLLWSAVGVVILISIVLHGATVTPVMRYIDGRSRCQSRLGAI